MKAQQAADRIHRTAGKLEFPSGRVTQSFLDALAEELREVARDIVHGNAGEYERSQAAATFGAIGGASRSPRKVAASRANIVGWHRRQGHRLGACPAKGGQS